jgi:hypothetical protein
MFSSDSPGLRCYATVYTRAVERFPFRPGDRPRWASQSHATAVLHRVPVQGSTCPTRARPSLASIMHRQHRGAVTATIGRPVCERTAGLARAGKRVRLRDAIPARYRHSPSPRTAWRLQTIPPRESRCRSVDAGRSTPVPCWSIVPQASGKSRMPGVGCRLAAENWRGHMQTGPGHRSTIVRPLATPLQLHREPGRANPQVRPARLSSMVWSAPSLVPAAPASRRRQPGAGHFRAREIGRPAPRPRRRP